MSTKHPVHLDEFAEIHFSPTAKAHGSRGNLAKYVKVYTPFGEKVYSYSSVLLSWLKQRMPVFDYTFGQDKVPKQIHAGDLAFYIKVKV